MTKNERSLLLFFECCAVDFNGRVDLRRMNEDDIATAKRWNEEGFVLFGRVIFNDVVKSYTHWCELSNDAWKLVPTLRYQRAQVALHNRSYKRTSE